MTYAQHGEDGLLAERFGSRHGVFVEVGAYNGVDLSNTYLLERDHGWTGLLVEPSPTQAASCRELRSCAVAEAAAVAPDEVGTVTLHIAVEGEAFSSLHHSAQIRRRFGDDAQLQEVEVRAATLDQLLNEAGIDKVDLLSVDVEGHEIEALRGFDLQRHQPTVALIERPSRWPDVQVLFHMARAGYGYRTTIGVNDWYEPGSVAAGGFRILWGTGTRAMRALLRRMK